MKIIAVVVLFLASSFSFADGLGSIKETRALSDKIMSHFVNAEFQKGLALAKPFWPLPQVEIDGLANQIATQWPIVDQRFGKAAGHEFVREERIGDSLVRYYYLHKFQNHAIYWQFTFYKPLNTWKMNSVTFLDNLEPLFERVE